MQVYLPRDLVDTARGYLVGVVIDDCYVICDVVDDLPASLPQPLAVVGLINLDHGPLRFKNDFLNRFPYLSENTLCFVVVFNPPNYRNFEYFAILPILLQLVGTTAPPCDYAAQLCQWPSPGVASTSLANDRVLEAVNLTLTTRKRLRRHGLQPDSETTPETTGKITPETTGETKTNTTATSSIRRGLRHLQLAGIFALSVVSRGLNYSATLRQAQLRLWQLVNLPVHFGLYKGWLDLDHLRTKLPVFNSNVNVANSNYINFYNTLWCFVNDVVIGRTVLAWIRSYSPEDVAWGVARVETLLFGDFSDYITWVALHHPAGFKLNDQLGRFMEGMYQWTVDWWRGSLAAVVPDAAAVVYAAIHSPMMTVVCHLGVTFTLAVVIDVVKALTLHIRVFATVATKVYHKHLMVVLLLFQLYQGKKYNTLRHRVDHENYETDQLLMGTLLSMVLALLLPTVLAFYWLFFISHGLVLVAINILEDLQTIVGFMPWFPCLLKIKNSNRLQGGVTFTRLSTQGKTLIVQLSNKSLGWKEIFQHFPQLFKRWQLGTVFPQFLRGRPLAKTDLREVQARYLMLPDEPVLI